MIYQGSVAVTEIILHCAAIKTGQFDGKSAFDVFQTINRWHTEKGWRGFGYHGLFMPDGQFYAGRPFDVVGAHTLGKNTGSLGFLLIESREITRLGEFGDWFTQAQDKALRDKIAALREVEGISYVTGHNVYAAKLCPGFDVLQWHMAQAA